MKKIMILALAAVAMSFAACGGQTRNTAELDSLSVSTSAEASPTEQATAVINLLQEQLQQADPDQVKAISEQIAQQVAKFVAAGDQAAADKYAETIGNFISENVVKLQQAGVLSSLSEALSSVQGIPAGIADVVNDATVKGDTAVAAVKDAIEATPEAVKEAVKEQAGKTIDEAAKAAKEQLGL